MVKRSLLPAQRFLTLQQTNTAQVLKKFKCGQSMITEAAVLAPFQPTRWRGLKLARFRPTLMHVLLQPVLRAIMLQQTVLGATMLQQTVVGVLLQTVRGAARVTAAPLQERPLPEQEQQQLLEQERQQLLEQEEHLLLEQTLELATGGKDHQSEALHLVMYTMQAAPLHVRLSLDVPQEHVVNAPLEHVVSVEPEHVVRVEPGHALRARRAVTVL